MTALAFIVFLVAFIGRMISTYWKRQTGSSAEAVAANEDAQESDVLYFGGSTTSCPTGFMMAEVFSIGPPFEFSAM